MRKLEKCTQLEVAEITKFSKSEADAYEDSLKSYRDLKNSLDTAFEEGVEQGIGEGIKQVALNALKRGMSDELIIELTGLTTAQLDILRAKGKQS